MGTPTGRGETPVSPLLRWNHVLDAQDLWVCPDVRVHRASLGLADLPDFL